MSPKTLPDEPIIPAEADGWRVDVYPSVRVYRSYSVTDPDGVETDFNAAMETDSGWALYRHGVRERTVRRQAVPEPVADALDHLAQTTSEVEA